MLYPLKISFNKEDEQKTKEDKQTERIHHQPSCLQEMLRKFLRQKIRSTQKDEMGQILDIRGQI